MFRGTPHPVGTTDRTPDGAEIDEQTGRCDQGRHAGVDCKVSIWNPVKKPSGHGVDDYCQHNTNVRDMQLPRLMRSVDQWAVNAHLPPGENDLSDGIRTPSSAKNIKPRGAPRNLCHQDKSPIRTMVR